MRTIFYKILYKGEKVVYVGVTTRTIGKRFKEHLKSKGLNPNNYFIVEFDRIKHPEINSLKTFYAEHKKVAELERKYIKEELNRGSKLLNLSEGGEWGTSILNKLRKEKFLEKFGSYDGYKEYKKKKGKVRVWINNWILHRSESKLKSWIRNWKTHRNENKVKIWLRSWILSRSTNKAKIWVKSWVYHRGIDKTKRWLRSWVYSRSNNKTKIWIRNWIIVRSEDKTKRWIAHWIRHRSENKTKVWINNWINNRSGNKTKKWLFNWRTTKRKKI